MRLSAIDVDTADESIQCFLDRCIHCTPGCTDPPPADFADQCVPYQCEQGSQSTASKMARALYYKLVDQKAKPGTLVCLCESFTSESYAYLLGVTQQRPLMQTFVHVTFKGNGDIHFICVDDVPEVSTSHQIFNLIAARTNNTEFTVDVQMWSCGMKWVDGHSLIAHAEAIVADFCLDSASLQRRQPEKVPMPFGLKTNRPRKKALRKEKTKQGPRAKKTLPVNLESESESQSDMESDIDLEAESNPIQPISDTMVMEAESAKEVAREIDATDEMKANLAEQFKAGELKPSTSFFSKTLGLDDAGFAASSRSICLACKRNIGKGDVRFSWYHSTLKPHSWVHSHCVAQLVESTGLRDRAISRLTEISQRAGGSQSGSLQAEAKTILRMLQC